VWSRSARDVRTPKSSSALKARSGASSAVVPAFSSHLRTCPSTQGALPPGSAHAVSQCGVNRGGHELRRDDNSATGLV
jgi:hypothetical protein